MFPSPPVRQTVLTGGCSLALGACCLLTPPTVTAGQPRIIHFPARPAAVEGQRQEPVLLTVMGAVNKPAAYRFYEKKIPLGELIGQAGGVTARAGQTVHILRGGRAAIVLRYPEQQREILHPGDVVILAEGPQSRSATVSFQYPSQTAGEGGPAHVVRKAAYEQAEGQSRGHIVLLGLKSTPVVMPLWTPGLTTDVLLTHYLKQPPEVAQNTQLATGSLQRTSLKELQDGMVLKVPPTLVRPELLPQLPEVVEVKPAAAVPENESTPEPLITPVEPLPLSTSEATQDRNSASSVAGLELPLTSSDEEKSETYSKSPTMPLPAAERQSDGLHSIEEMLQKTMISMEKGAGKSVEASLNPADFSAGGKFATPVTLEPSPHLATAEEVVPNPRDVSESASPSWIGWMAGLVVLGGVLTVVGHALYQHFFGEEKKFLGRIKKLFSQSADARSFAIESSRRTQQENLRARADRHLSGQPVRKSAVIAEAAIAEDEWLEELPAAAFEASAAESSSAPRTRVQTDKEPLTPQSTPVESARQSTAAISPEFLALLQRQIPVVEERVTMPRELKFFGKPLIDYEFRIDAAHEIPKPHIPLAAQQTPVTEKETENSIEKVVSHTETFLAAESTSEDSSPRKRSTTNWRIDAAEVISGSDELQKKNLSGTSTQKNASAQPTASGLFASAYSLARQQNAQPRRSDSQ